MVSPIQFFTHILGGLLGSIGVVWGYVWWIVLPIFTAFLFWDFWIMYIRFKFVTAIQWKLLEIKVPKNNLRTPKSMEQIFAAAHAPFSYGMNKLEKYWEGKVEYWMSFEMIGRAGELRFFLRLPKQFQTLMESAIYAQYPDAELKDVDPADDYLKQFKRLPNEKYNMFGTDIVLAKPSAYPIRTYMMFEDPIEERRIDPIASLAESMSRLKDDEQLWIQYLVRPAGPEWKAEAQKVVDKIIGKKEPKKKGLLDDFTLGVTLGDAIRAPWVHPATVAKEKKPEREGPLSNILYLSPGERAVLEAIERKTQKLGFETTMRYIYIDNREKFSREHIAAFTGMLRLFTLQDSNLLKPDKDTMTSAPKGLFKAKKVLWRQRIMHEHYEYLIPSHKSHTTVFNIEELATLYHFPLTIVAAPKLERVESRKGGPPPSLPTMG